MKCSQSGNKFTLELIISQREHILKYFIQKLLKRFFTGKSKNVVKNNEVSK